MTCNREPIILCIAANVSGEFGWRQLDGEHSCLVLDALLTHQVSSSSDKLQTIVEGEHTSGYQSSVLAQATNSISVRKRIYPEMAHLWPATASGLIPQLFHISANAYSRTKTADWNARKSSSV